MHIRQTRGQPPSPIYNGNISVADYMPLYIAYSKLLKLTAAFNAGGV